ncbi:MAG: protein kinase domain-containing protein [Thermoplasmatota archaeon]
MGGATVAPKKQAGASAGSAWNWPVVRQETMKKYADKFGTEAKKVFDREWPLVQQALKAVKNGKLSAFQYGRCIAVAGSRVVYLCERPRPEGEGQEKIVLKVCRPLEKVIPLVLNEYNFLRESNHTNIVRIHWATQVTVGKANGRLDLPLTVEEYIGDGKDLQKWIEHRLGDVHNERDLLPMMEALRGILDGAIDALEYLHQAGKVHADIKPENILVDGETAKLVDFGYSKRVPTPDLFVNDSTVKQFGFTWAFASPVLRRRIHSMDTPAAAVAHDSDPAEWKKFDMYALGRTIEDCVARIQAHRKKLVKEREQRDEGGRSTHEANCAFEERFFHVIAACLKGQDALLDEPDWRGAFNGWHADLVDALAYNPDYHTTWREVKTDLDKLGLDNLGARIPEWDHGGPELIRSGQVDVPFTARVRRVVNHPAMSRLAEVSQLGMVAFVYPGARHSRLEHALGTYGHACRYLEALWQSKADPLLRARGTIEQIQAISLAALLHDVGQYPHCHDLEDAIPDLPRHDKFTREIYRMRMTVATSVPVQATKGKSKAEQETESLEDIVRDEWGAEVADQLGLLLREPGESNRILRALSGICSGPIDADKMDYLQRDALASGVGYGEQPETARLLRALTLVRDGPNLRMGVSSKGIFPAQCLIIGRQQMLERVYWHKTVRSFKAMLGTALRVDLKNLSKTKETIKQIQGPLATWATTEALPPEASHLSFTDRAALVRLQEAASNQSAKYLLGEILQRRPYKKLIDLDPSLAQDDGLRNDIRDAVRALLWLHGGTLGSKGQASSQSAAVQALEEVRVLAQAELLDAGTIRAPGRLDRAAHPVALLVDFPNPGKFGQSRLMVADSTEKPARTVELGFGVVDDQQAWVRSTMPRLYLHPRYEPAGRFEEIAKSFARAVRKRLKA